MDTTATKIDVTAQINEIKAHMPETYKAIQAKAYESGNVVYEYVRRGLRGEPNCFYAFERGWVKGKPFDGKELELTRDVKCNMVELGCAHVCFWAAALVGGNHGAN